MTSAVETPRAEPRHRGLARACDAIDAINDAVGRWLGPMIIFVTFAILYEVGSRTAFGVATIWANEATIYGSAAVYLLAGGYALRHGRHVSIDGFVGAMPAAVQRALPVIRLPFLLLYALTLVVVGGTMAWTSFVGSEGTGTPWNPPIWPLKAAIPLAGVLLALQMLVDVARQTGLVPPARAA